MMKSLSDKDFLKRMRLTLFIRFSQQHLIVMLIRFAIVILNLKMYFWNMRITLRLLTSALLNLSTLKKA